MFLTSLIIYMRTVSRYIQCLRISQQLQLEFAKFDFASFMQISSSSFQARQNLSVDSFIAKNSIAIHSSTSLLN